MKRFAPMLITLLALAACSAPPAASTATGEAVRTVTSGKFALEIHSAPPPGFDGLLVREVETGRTLGEYHPATAYENLGLTRHVTFARDGGAVLFTYGVFVQAVHLWDFQHDRLSTVALLPSAQDAPAINTGQFDLQSLVFSGDGQQVAANFCDAAENHGRGCRYVTLTHLDTGQSVLLKAYLPLQHALSFAQQDTALVLEGCAHGADGVIGVCLSGADGRTQTTVEVKPGTS